MNGSRNSSLIKQINAYPTNQSHSHPPFSITGFYREAETSSIGFMVAYSPHSAKHYVVSQTVVAASSSSPYRPESMNLLRRTERGKGAIGRSMNDDHGAVISPLLRFRIANHLGPIRRGGHKSAIIIVIIIVVVTTQPSSIGSSHLVNHQLPTFGSSPVFRNGFANFCFYFVLINRFGFMDSRLSSSLLTRAARTHLEVNISRVCSW